MASITPLYKTKATAHGGGRDGRVVSESGLVNFDLRPPKEFGGSGEGTNPEELFAATYSACFLSAVHVVVRNEKIDFPKDATITAEIGIGKLGEGFGINAELTANFPGMDQAAAENLVQKAHQICPYSNATRGNIDVNLVVNV